MNLKCAVLKRTNSSFDVKDPSRVIQSEKLQPQPHLLVEKTENSGHKMKRGLEVNHMKSWMGAGEKPALAIESSKGGARRGQEQSTVQIENGGFSLGTLRSLGKKKP